MESQYYFRPLSAWDESFLWEMLYEAVYVPENEQRPPRSIIHKPELAKYVQAWGQPGDMGFLAEDMQIHQLVGAAWLRLLTGDKRGYGWVDDAIPELSIALVPNYRGKGVGTALILKVLGEAQAHYPGVSLSVSQGNPAARLYQRLGFVIVSEDASSWTMLKRFTAPDR